MDQEDLGFKRLADMVDFSQSQQRDAIKAVIAELENEGENPNDFFVKFEQEVAVMSKLSFELIHQDSFDVKSSRVLGNPSGKDRKAVYDLIQKKVTFLIYQ